MIEFGYHMPTKVFFGKDSVLKNWEVFSTEGSQALIVTGRTSSRKNGSLDDIESALKKAGIAYEIFDDIEENPSLETAERAAEAARRINAQFIVAVGGGSPLDCAKGVAVLAKNRQLNGRDLVGEVQYGGLSVIAVPTTSGTGSEVTHYAIFTDHREKTKKNFSHRLFPKYAMLDPKYTLSIPNDITVNTAVDALSHLVEGYMARNVNHVSDALAEKGFEIFSKCIKPIEEGRLEYEDREKLMLASMIAGMVISQSGTSLPHGMGYALTYFHNVEHGRANGILMKAYLESCRDKERVEKVMGLLGFSDLEELGSFIKRSMRCDVEISKEQIESYAKDMMKNENKLKNHPQEVCLDDIIGIYMRSLIG